MPPTTLNTAKIRLYYYWKKLQPYNKHVMYNVIYCSKLYYYCITKVGSYKGALSYIKVVNLLYLQASGKIHLHVNRLLTKHRSQVF